MHHLTRGFPLGNLSVKVASGAKVRMVGSGTAIIPVVNDRGNEVLMSWERVDARHEDDAYNKTGKRTRHINLRFHRVREAVAKNSIDVKRVTGGNDPATSEMVADILTKSTPAPLFVVMASIMSGMHRK